FRSKTNLQITLDWGFGSLYDPGSYVFPYGTYAPGSMRTYKFSMSRPSYCFISFCARLPKNNIFTMAPPIKIIINHVKNNVKMLKYFTYYNCKYNCKLL